MAADKNVPYEEFGERLIGLRKQHGMTRQQLGEICGIARTPPSKWLRPSA